MHSKPILLLFQHPFTKKVSNLNSTKSQLQTGKSFVLKSQSWISVGHCVLLTTNYHAIQYHSPIHNRVTFPYQIRSTMKKKKTRWKKLGRLIRSQLLPVRRFAHFFSGALTTEMSRLSVTGPLPFKGIIGRSVFSNGSTRAREN